MQKQKGNNNTAAMHKKGTKHQYDDDSIENLRKIQMATSTAAPKSCRLPFKRKIQHQIDDKEEKKIEENYRTKWLNIKRVSDISNVCFHMFNLVCFYFYLCVSE